MEPVLKRPIWEATSIPHSTFFVQKCPNVRHSFRYVWIYFFSYIHNFQGRHFLVLLSFFFLLQKFKMLTTTMWPHILQITTRRHCRAISRKKYRPAEPNVHILLPKKVHIRLCRSVRHGNNGVFILLPGSGFLPRSGIWFSKSSAIRSSWIVHRGNKLVQCWSLYSNCSVSLSIF